MKLKFVLLFALGFVFLGVSFAQSDHADFVKKDSIALQVDISYHITPLSVDEATTVKPVELVSVSYKETLANSNIIGDSWAFIVSHWQSSRLCHFDTDTKRTDQNPVPLLAQVTDTSSWYSSIWNFLVSNWQSILNFIVSLIASLEIFTRLTPSTKDDTALDWVKKLFGFFIPNLRSGGGTHN